MIAHFSIRNQLNSIIFSILLLFSPTVSGCISTVTPDDLPGSPQISGPGTTTLSSALSTTTTSMPTTTTTPACLPGWLFFAESASCYFLGAFLGLSITDARVYCMGLGGDLASIHSDAENAFVTSLTPPGLPGQRMAIGVFRIGTGNTNDNFVNFDGTPLDYTNWAPLRPDNSGGNQYCVILATDMLAGGPTRGQWNDFPCDSVHRYFVCKTPKL